MQISCLVVLLVLVLTVIESVNSFEDEARDKDQTVMTDGHISHMLTNQASFPRDHNWIKQKKMREKLSNTVSDVSVPRDNPISTRILRAQALPGVDGIKQWLHKFLDWIKRLVNGDGKKDNSDKSSSEKHNSKEDMDMDDEDKPSSQERNSNDGTHGNHVSAVATASGVASIPLASDNSKDPDTVHKSPITNGIAYIPDEMVSLMDPSADPGIDFYHYTCGGWMKTHSLKDSETHLQVIDRRNDKLSKKIVRENHPVVRELWDSCMDTKKLTERGNKPLQKDLKRILDATTKKQVLKLAGEFSRTGSNAFIKFRIDLTKEVKRAEALYVYVASNLPPYEENEYGGHRTNAYITYINKLIKLSGFTSFEGIENDAKGAALYNLEENLVLFELQSQTSSTKESIPSATERWPTAFGAFWSGVVEHTKSLVKEVILHDDYFDHLEKTIASTSLEDLKLYVAFMMVHSRVLWLDDTFYQAWFPLFGKVEGKMEEQPTRTSFCEASLLANIPDLIGEYFYRKAFNPSKEKYALEMIKWTQEAMRQHITRSDWFHPTDKKHVQNKLNHAISHVGFTKFPKSYPSGMSRYDYSSNMYKLKAHRFDLDLKSVGQRLNRHEWEEFSKDDKAHYDPTKNVFVFPTTVLQPPLFNATNFHPARNFGGIGHTISREFTHAFDSKHIDRDGDGKYHATNVITKSAIQEHTKCLVDQYKTIQRRGEEIENDSHGFKKLEDVADNAGLSIAWDAYRKYMSNDKRSSFGLTPEEGEKLFFVAYGQTHCGKMKNGIGTHDLYKHSYSPGHVRVNGVVMNSEKFATVFGCKLNTPMNPVHKCKMW